MVFPIRIYMCVCEYISSNTSICQMIIGYSWKYVCSPTLQIVCIDRSVRAGTVVGKGSLFVRGYLIHDIQMRDGTIEVIVTPLTNGTRASRSTWRTARRGAKRVARRHDIAGGCQTPTGEAGHALLPFRGVKWKSKRYNGVATSPRRTVSSPPRSRLSSLFLTLRLCPLTFRS